MEYDVPNAVAVLERTPGTLRALLGGLPAVWTESNEGPDTWSAYDVLGHMIHGERADWIGRSKIILAQGENRTFAAYDRTAMYRESEGKSLETLLDEFAVLRAENLATLASWNLTDAQLALEGRHLVLGTASLRQLLATWVAHDLGHLAQIARVMAKQYRDAVGPWRQFLPVLDRGGPPA